MKIQLIDSHPGAVTAVVLKEWMRIGLSICLLGLPVILGYFSIQLAEARNAEFAKDSSAPALGDEFDFARQASVLPHTSQNAGSPNTSPGLRQDLQAYFHQGQATVENQAVALFASYEDALKKRQLLALAGAIEYVSESFRSFVLHKNGRVIDPASYIHSTIR